MRPRCRLVTIPLVLLAVTAATQPPRATPTPPVEPRASDAAASPDPTRPGPSDWRELAEAITADARYQTALPGLAEITEQEFDPPDWFGPLGTLLFWTLIAVLAVLLLLGAFLLLRAALRSDRLDAGGRTRPGRGGGHVPAPAFHPSRLAEAGRYAEAIHALLLLALIRLSGRADLALEPALTSRELLRGLPLEPAPRDALGRLVHTVEHCWFGGRDVDAADWDACRGDYRVATGEEPT